MTGSITLLCGISGSGKSTWAVENRPHAVVVCPDDFRLALTGRDFFRAAEDAVWSNVKITARVLAGIRNMDILIDATSLTASSRSQWIHLGRDIKTPIHAIVFEVPFEVCMERNNARSRVVPEDVMLAQKEAFVEPSEEEGFASITRVVYQSEKSRNISTSLHGHSGTCPSANG